MGVVGAGNENGRGDVGDGTCVSLVITLRTYLLQLSAQRVA